MAANGVPNFLEWAVSSGSTGGCTAKLSMWCLKQKDLPFHLSNLQQKYWLKDAWEGDIAVEDVYKIFERSTNDVTRLQGKETVKSDDITTATELAFPDMPLTVLDGALGEICKRRLLPQLPVAYAWPACLATASALVDTRRSSFHTNLFVALVGDVHGGKTVAIDHAQQVLSLGERAEPLNSGSGEGLLATVGDRNGDSVLISTDELGHLLEKAQISNATYAYVLTRLFYQPKFQLTVTQRKQVSFNARLSLIGGIVREKFGDGFGSATTAGLYDRFLFGLGPEPFTYLYRPLEGPPELAPGELGGGTDTRFTPPQVICPNVWDARDAFVKSENANPRIAELAIRAAMICAAVDGRTELRAEDLKPAWELARYQSTVRLTLKPNSGKTYEAQAAYKILEHLKLHALNSKWLDLRDVKRNTGVNDYGPVLVDRVVSTLHATGDIELTDAQKAEGSRGPKKKLVRLATTER